MMATIMTPGTDQATIMALTTLTILPTTLGAAIIGAEAGVGGAVGEIGDGIAAEIGITATVDTAVVTVMAADAVTKRENL